MNKTTKGNKDKGKKTEKETLLKDPSLEENVEACEGEIQEYILSAEEFDEIKNRIETIQKERDEYLNTAKRTQADLDNYRKRNANLRVEALQDGKDGVICELLPVIDNFERAIGQAREQGQDEGFIEGFDLIHKQIVAILDSNKIEVIEGEGEVFDPNLQMAVMQEEAPDMESGTVTEVLQRGYRVKDGKVLRHAMVKVAQ